MNRRHYLLGAVGTASALAGCLGSDPGGGSGVTTDESEGSTTTGTGQSTTVTSEPGSVRPPTVGDVDLPVKKSELNRGARKDAIPAITDPKFGPDWSGVEYSLSDDDRVIGVDRDGEARAYPLAILDWHEVVNDSHGGPLLVTFCPLCGSGLTAVRKVDGEETLFGVSGYLFRSDLVMYDRKTDSLWSQIMATAINGPQTGERLTLVPSSLTTWGAWKDEHDDPRVLLPPPKSGTIVDARPRPYDREAYTGYGENRQIGIGYNGFDDDRLHPKAKVIGVATDTAAKAYPFESVVDKGAINDTVGDLPVVVAAGPEETLYAYVRRVDGETLQFETAEDGRLRAGGSEWLLTTGEAVSGPYAGTRLKQASNATTMFWFAWLDFNPETTVYGQE